MVNLSELRYVTCPFACDLFPDRTKALTRSNTTSGVGVTRVVTKIEAAGLNEALQNALKALRLVLDVANFYNRSAPFRLCPSVYLESASTEKFIYTDTQLYSEFLKPTRNAIDLTSKMQQAGVLARLPERIITALEQYSVAHSSSDPKVRFVNPWVALETIAGHEREGPIIDNVVRNVVPLIVHRKINKVIKYLAICLHKFGFCGKIPDSTGWFKSSTRHEVRRDELLLALSGAGGAAVHDDLARLTLEHPLLCNRLFQVHKMLRIG